MQKKDLVEIRDFREADRNFIFATWLRGLYYGNSFFNMIPEQIFMEYYNKVVALILDAPETEIKIACLKDDPEVILGYAVLSRAQTVLHWCYVKAAWRRIKIAQDLVPNTVKSVTHLTRIGLAILKTNPTLVFNPFLIP